MLKQRDRSSTLRVARRLAPYCVGQRALLGASLMALLASTALRLLEPWPLAWVIDRVVAPGKAPRPLDAFSAIDPGWLLALIALAVVIIAATKALTRYWSTIGFALAGNRITGRVRTDLFEHLQALSLRFHRHASTGELTTRLIGDVGLLKDVMVMALMPLVASVLTLAGMVGVMLWLDWQLALIALAPMPILWILGLRRGRRIHEASRRSRKREGAMAATATEAMSAIRLVQSLSLEALMSRAFRGADADGQRDDVRARRLAAGLERSVDLLIAAATAVVLWQGALRVLSGTLSAGDLLVFLSYLKNAFRPLREYAKYTARLSKALAAAERIVDLFEQRPEPCDAPDARPAPVLARALRFERLGFGYEPGAARVLDDFDLEVRAGQCVAIVGPSGAGKSTIASLLLRLIDPLTGAIRVDGADLREFGLTSLRQRIGLVPQDNLLFAATVRENLSLAALHEPTLEEIVAAARMANAHEFICALPKGYETVLGECGADLSGGERQRIAIARAALRDSTLVIFDEPTVGLDAANERIVIEAMWRLLEGRTGILITHDLALAARADHIVCLDRGRIREQGTHAQLLARGGCYAAWWRLQALHDRGDTGSRCDEEDAARMQHAA